MQGLGFTKSTTKKVRSATKRGSNFYSSTLFGTYYFFLFSMYSSGIQISAISLSNKHILPLTLIILRINENTLVILPKRKYTILSITQAWHLVEDRGLLPYTESSWSKSRHPSARSQVFIFAAKTECFMEPLLFCANSCFNYFSPFYISFEYLLFKMMLWFHVE